MDTLKYFYKNVSHATAKKLYSSKRNRYFVVKGLSPGALVASLEHDAWAARASVERTLARSFDKQLNVILFFMLGKALVGYALMKSMPGESAMGRDPIPGVKLEGTPFDVCWIRFLELPPSEYSNLTNKLNNKKSLVKSKDGHEVDGQSGYALCKLFERKFRALMEAAANPVPHLAPPLVPGAAPLLPDISPKFLLSKSHFDSVMARKNVGGMQSLQRNLKMKGANVYSLDMASEFNPALLVFPVDLSNMSYDTYISLYNYSHRYWLEMPPDYQIPALGASNT